MFVWCDLIIFFIFVTKLGCIMKKTINVSLLSLLSILFGCNDDSHEEMKLLYESVSIEYRIKEVIALEDPVFNGIYDNKDYNSPIMVHTPIESEAMYSSVFYFPQNICSVETFLPLINENGELVGNTKSKYIFENGVTQIFTDSIAYIHSFEIPVSHEYKLESSNSGYQIFAEYFMKVKNSADGNISDISGEWNGIIYTTNKLIVTNEKNDTINFKENMINFSL